MSTHVVLKVSIPFTMNMQQINVQNANIQLSVEKLSPLNVVCSSICLYTYSVGFQGKKYSGVHMNTSSRHNQQMTFCD